jgi:hypothetical protein
VLLARPGHGRALPVRKGGGVLLYVGEPSHGDVGVRKDGGYRTFRYARTTPSAFRWVYDQLVFHLIDAVDRANLDAGVIDNANTRLGNDISHENTSDIELSY